MFAYVISALLAAGPVTAPPIPVVPVVPAIDSLELAGLMQKDSNLLLFDFRSQSEFENGHVPFAVNLPLSAATRQKVEARLEQMAKGAPRSVVLYGSDPITLSELAAKAAAVNSGPLAVYPGGVEGWAQSEGGYLEIEWPGLFRMLTLRSPVLLDVREEAEFAAGHIPGARHFNAPVAAKSLTEKPWSELRQAGRPVIAYCSGDLCGESRRLAALLRKAGVKQVYQFPGGYPEWEERARCLK